MTAEGKWRPDAEPTGERQKISPVVLDPRTLIRGNLAFRALDTRVLAGMTGANFKPQWYDTQRAEVIRVVDPDPSNQRGYYFMPYNGYHRIWAADSYITYLQEQAAAGAIQESEANYEFVAHDVTDTLTDRTSGQTVLTSSGLTAFTPKQALELVITPTEAHEDIASRRFAGHILTEWENMVPKSVSERYSALAALTFLGRNELRDKPAAAVDIYLGLAPEEPAVAGTTSHHHDPEDETAHLFATVLDLADVIVGHKGINEIDEYERTLHPLMASLSEDERPALAQGLSEIAGVIRNAKRGYDDIALNAFQIVASLEGPGSEETKLRQVAGILAVPEVHEKIAAGARDENAIAERQAELGLFLHEAIPQAAENTREIRTLRQALTDPHLSYNNLVDVLRIPTEEYTPRAGETDMRLISNRYDVVRKAINFQNLRTRLAPDADDIALQLARNLSTPKIMDTGQLARVARDIEAAERLVVEEAEPIVERLEVAARRAGEGSPAHTLLSRYLSELDHLQTRARTANALTRTTVRIRELITDAEELLRPPQGASRTETPGANETAVFEANIGTPEEQIAAAIRLVETVPLTPGVREGLRRLRSIADAKIGFDWNDVTLDREDGKNGWFSSRYRRGETTPRPVIRHKVTKMIQRIVESISPQFQTARGAEIFESVLRDKDDNRGLDAVDNSLSPRLFNLAGNLGWDISTREFTYLALSHYAFSASARLAELEGKFVDGTLSGPEEDLRPTIERLSTVLNHSVDEYRKRNLGSRTDKYLDLLRYALYTSPDDDTNKQARRLLQNGVSNTAVISRAADDFKELPHHATVEELFNTTVWSKAEAA